MKADEGCHAERWPYESQWKQEAYRQGLPVGLLHAGHGEACEARAMPCCVGTPQPAAAAVLPQNALPPVRALRLMKAKGKSSGSTAYAIMANKRHTVG